MKSLLSKNPKETEHKQTNKDSYQHLFSDRNVSKVLTNYITDPRVLFATYWGGNGWDRVYSVVTDSHNNIIAVGCTGSTDFHVTDGAFQTEKKYGHDMFITKFTEDGQLIWSTYFGGNNIDVGTDVAIDSEDNIIVF